MGSKKDILKVKNYIKEVLKYTFSNDSLMINSITHKSIGYQNYERLEFLGDAVLQLAITEILVKKYTEIAEGALSRERQSLVNRKILSKISIQLGLDKLIISKNLNTSKSKIVREKISANIFESILGAIYIDSNYNQCRKIITNIFSETINSKKQIGKKDSKTKLQEYLQSKNLNLPIYQTTKIKSPDHKPKFEISCRIDILDKIVSTISSTVKDGEQIVAKKILDKINIYEK